MDFNCRQDRPWQQRAAGFGFPLIGFLPNLIGFLVILVVGYFIAKIAQGDRLSKALEKVGLDRTLKPERRRGIRREGEPWREPCAADRRLSCSGSSSSSSSPRRLSAR